MDNLLDDKRLSDLFEAKIALEKARLREEDERIRNIALKETDELCYLIYEKLIANLNLSKEVITATWGIYPLKDTAAHGRSDELRLAKEYNSRHDGNDTILMAVYKDKVHFISYGEFMAKLAKAHVKVQKGCRSAINRWKFLISAMDMINNYSNRIDSNDETETTEKTNSR